MTTKHDPVHLAAQRLLDIAGRVLGPGADLGERHRYVNELLSRFGARMDPALRAQIRFACYEQLFGDVAIGRPQALDR